MRRQRYSCPGNLLHILRKYKFRSIFQLHFKWQQEVQGPTVDLRFDSLPESTPLPAFLSPLPHLAFLHVVSEIQLVALTALRIGQRAEKLLVVVGISV